LVDQDPKEFQNVSNKIKISEHSNPTIIEVNYNSNYKISIWAGHYTIQTINKERKSFNYILLDEDEMNIIDIILDRENIYDEINKNFYWIKWNKDSLIREFNIYFYDNSIDNKLYINTGDFVESVSYIVENLDGSFELFQQINAYQRFLSIEFIIFFWRSHHRMKLSIKSCWRSV
jgi:hypothetical protein